MFDRVAQKCAWPSVDKNMKSKTFLRSFRRHANSDWKTRLRIISQSQYARVGLVSMTVFMGLFYVLQMNVAATKGYDIRELEQAKTALQKDYRHLELEAMELQSVDRLMAQLHEVRLVEARPDQYLKTTATTVATR
jgi:hypothetical protein